MAGSNIKKRQSSRADLDKWRESEVGSASHWSVRYVAESALNGDMRLAVVGEILTVRALVAAMTNSQTIATQCTRISSALVKYSGLRAESLGSTAWQVPLLRWLAGQSEFVEQAVRDGLRGKRLFGKQGRG